MARHRVHVKLGTALTASIVEKEKPDVLVVASGAKHGSIDVPGVEKPHVLSAWDVLAERAVDIGDRVVIIGGSATGCETAHFIASMGTVDSDSFAFLMYHSAEDVEFAKELLHDPRRQITVVDMLPRLAANAGKTSRWVLMKNLALMGVDLRPSTQLLEITDDSVVVETAEGRQKIPADTVVMAVGAVSVNDLAEQVRNDRIEVIVIGDAKEPRKINDAIREGFQEALNV
jgi:2,4-dienoyl-CoA reductase (NADPH2)